MKSIYTVISFVFVMSFVSCRHTSDVGDTAHVRNVAEAASELPLPEVPSSLVSPEERAAYVMLHFWDAMDFSDTTRCNDTAFMEQNIVNFISMLPHAEKSASAEAFGTFIKRVAANPDALRLIYDIMENYLAFPNSPMRNEEYYIIFLEELLRLPSLSESERIRPQYQLEMAKKNRPGTRASDFRFIDSKGIKRTLHKIHGDNILLLFYDPECTHCWEILQQVHESQVIKQSVADGRLTVLAVYAEGNRTLWNDTKHAMPRQWNVGFVTDKILENEKYSLPAMPVLYLLDHDKTVLLKDAPFSAIEARLRPAKPMYNKQIKKRFPTSIRLKETTV